MLFVMFIVGLIVGLTAPRLGAGIDRYELLAQRQSIEDQLRQLPRRARLVGRAIELPHDIKSGDIGDDHPALSIPSDWSITFSPPLVISRLGACSETEVQLQSAKDMSATQRYKLTEPACELLPLAP